MKACARCGESKRLDAYYVNHGWRDGRHPYCKACLLAYQRERRRAKLDLAEPNRRRWSRSFVRHDYFADVTEPNQSYLAGLLAADGNVLERQRRVTLELCKRDEELVHFARSEIAPGFPVRPRVRPNGCATTILAVTSERLCRDLAEIGITPRKSLTLRWPEGLDTACLRFFLLGYFDGDGYITRSRNGPYEYVRWGLCGTATFLSSAMRFVSEATGVRARRVHRSGTKQVHKLDVNGADALVVDDWLHDATELGLARKRLALNLSQADSAARSSW